MSEQQDERKRDPREDLITVTADARGPVSVEIMFTRVELELILNLMHTGSGPLQRSIVSKLQKLLNGGAR